MIIYKSGNLLEAPEDILCHQVNCKGVMGAGIAKTIKNKYPSVFNSYKKICDSYKSIDLLGKIQVLKAEGKYICNFFSQDLYGASIKQTDYIALRNCLEKVKSYAIKHNLSIAIPYRIGCGLAGGDWDIVSHMIEDVFYSYDIVIYKL